jgi:hypothetical protein
VIKLEDIKVGDTVYYVVLDIVEAFTCTGLRSFPGEDHFMVEHEGGQVHNGWCTKSREDAVAVVKIYRESNLLKLEKELLYCENRIQEALSSLDSPIEVRHRKLKCLKN